MATTAFDLGIDSPNIARVINCGWKATFEELVQQSERAWRNGILAEAIFVSKKRWKEWSYPQ